MPFFAWLARRFLLRRLTGGRAARRGVNGGGWYPGGGRRLSRSGGYGRRRGNNVGLFGPVPYASRRTRGGGRVSVGGCCLPIPLALTVAVAGALRLLTSQR